jgi:serine/threonine protein kinase
MNREPSVTVDTIIQQGGKLKGQGLYGCVWSPPLLTVKNTAVKNKKGVTTLGKVTEYSEVAKEIELSKFLSKFPETTDYCLLPDIKSISKIRPLSQQKDEDIKDCLAFERYDLNNMYQFHIQDGGITLREKLGRLKTDIHTFDFFKFVQQILEIGAFLILHGCIHNDMHSSNIVMDTNYKPRVIDFGRAYMYNTITETTVSELNARYSPHLRHITPESTAFDGVTDGVDIEQIYRDLYSMKETLKVIEQVLGVSRQAQIQEFRNFWKTSVCAQAEDWLTLHRLYWTVVDSWAIGNIIVQILKRFKMSKTFLQSSEWKEKGTIIQSVLKGLLRTSPYYRYDALEALAMYDPSNAFVNSESGRAWLSKKKSFV